MNQEINENIKKALQVWALIKRDKSFSEISAETGLHKSEISNIKKFTCAEMYIFDAKEAKKYIDELFEKRKLVKQYTHQIDQLIKKNKALQLKLFECQKPWWQKLYEKWS